MYPRQSSTTHTEQLADEVAVYDRARAEVHALNPTAARVWRQCDGATSPEAMAAALSLDRVPEAEAVVDLALRELARLHLVELPVESRGKRPARTRRWLLGRGVAAAMLPAIYSVVAPSPVDAQSPPPPGAPTLTSLSPNEGAPGTTVVVTVTGTGFGTTVAVSGTGVTTSNIEEISSTSLRVTFTIAANATPSRRNVMVTTAGGTSNALPFTITAPPPPTGDEMFDTVGSHPFTVPAGVVSITIVAAGAQGGRGFASGTGGIIGGTGGLGGRTTATVSVTPGVALTVRVGGDGPNGNSVINTPGGSNGGGGSQADGGGGGGASSVHDDATPLVVAGGGGGGGAAKGPALNTVGANGGAGGGLDADSGQIQTGAAGPGGGGEENMGGDGGIRASGTNTNTNGISGTADQGGDGGGDFGFVGGGGGGGGYFGGGGGGGGSQTNGVAGGGGGGGSSFAASGATDVEHEKGVNSGNGSVTISW